MTNGRTSVHSNLRNSGTGATENMEFSRRKYTWGRIIPGISMGWELAGRAAASMKRTQALQWMPS